MALKQGGIVERTYCKKRIYGMHVDEAWGLVEKGLAQMDALYMGVVFDEVILLSLHGGKVSILRYRGDRDIAIGKSFFDDIRALKKELIKPEHVVGDFAFTPHGDGEAFDAFIRPGPSCYVLLNNTVKATGDITADPAWKRAQRVFVELCERFRADPVGSE